MWNFKSINMIQKYAIGIDISKSKVDCAVLNFELDHILEKEVPNTKKELKKFLLQTIKELKIEKQDIVICCENTGIYNRPLEKTCAEIGVTIWVEHAIKIKRASTDMRGKDDRTDAFRIAEYCVRYIDRLVAYEEPSDEINELDAQVKVRETLLKQKTVIQQQLNEAKTHDPFEFKILEKSFSKVLRSIKQSLKETEAKIDAIICENKKLNTNKDLLMSIPGIGPQTAINFIITTDNFSKFKSAKHLACYAGVVPFKNESGIMIKKPRISKMANKNLKKLLHLAAMASIRSCGELREYYQRKVAEGKNKMSVLNAIRNKLVHRIMAVIQRQEPYLSQEEYLLKFNEKLLVL